MEDRHTPLPTTAVSHAPVQNMSAHKTTVRLLQVIIAHQVQATADAAPIRPTEVHRIAVLAASTTAHLQEVLLQDHTLAEATAQAVVPVVATEVAVTALAVAEDAALAVAEEAIAQAEEDKPQPFSTYKTKINYLCATLQG